MLLEAHEAAPDGQIKVIGDRNLRRGLSGNPEAGWTEIIYKADTLTPKKLYHRLGRTIPDARCQGMGRAF